MQACVAVAAKSGVAVAGTGVFSGDGVALGTTVATQAAAQVGQAGRKAAVGGQSAGDVGAGTPPLKSSQPKAYSPMPRMAARTSPIRMPTTSIKTCDRSGATDLEALTAGWGWVESSNAVPRSKSTLGFSFRHTTIGAAAAVSPRLGGAAISLQSQGAGVTVGSPIPLACVIMYAAHDRSSGASGQKALVVEWHNGSRPSL